MTKTAPNLKPGRFGFLVSAIPGLLVTGLILALHVWNPGAMAQAANLVFDVYQRAAPRAYVDAPVRIVDIDDESLTHLGQWPWPRTQIAELTDKLFAAGAEVVAYDIVFSEADRTSPASVAQLLRANPQARGDYADIAALADHDEVFGKALTRPGSVLGFFFTESPNETPLPVKAGFAFAGDPPLAAITSYPGIIAPLPVLSQGAAGGGFVTIARQGDRIVREAPLILRRGDEFAPSLALEALRLKEHAGAIQVRSTNGGSEQGESGELSVNAIKVGDRIIPTTGSGGLLVHFTAAGPDRLAPAWKVIEGTYSQAEMERLFKGRIVFVGAGAQGLQDLVATPLSDRELGVVVHAQIVEQILAGQFLSRPDWWPGLERILIGLIGLIVAFTMPRLGALAAGAIVLPGLAAVIAGSWFAFRQAGMLIDPIYLGLAVIAPHTVGALVAFYREERRRAYIRGAFGRYLSPELVGRIVKDPGQLELGGEERDMTVLFCDIRSFSRISEGLSPKAVIAFLIAFLTPMTDVLLARKATIDKYIGDAILAFWNAPLTDPDHARNAALAALEMGERLKALNAKPPKDWPSEVKIGVGINTGPCCVGNMGSAQRLSYSLIGDTVNLASRIEGLTKLYGVQILLGEDTAARLGDFALLEVDKVRVVGRDTPEHLFALLGAPALAQDEAFGAARSAWDKVIGAYRGQDWDGAGIALDAFAPHAGKFGLEGLTALYRPRIAAGRAAPPGPSWDGVFQAMEK